MKNKLRITKQVISVQYAAYDAETIETLSKYYPVHYNRKGTEAQLSGRLIPEILADFRGLDEQGISAAPQTLQDLYWSEMNAREKMLALLSDGPVENPVVTSSLTLMKHQQLGREIAKVRDRYCFFYDTRTGKTPLSLAVMYDDIKANPSHKWLVVAPLILLEEAWRADANDFVPELKVVNCHDTTRAKRQSKVQQEANIYLTNIESFANYKEMFEEVKFHGCIVDESSCMRSNKSKQTKALVDFSQQMKRFYLLSGRPSPNGLWEMYAQLKAIDWFSVPSSYTKFKERYFINVAYNSNFEDLQNNPATIGELKDIIAQYALYVDQDVLTMAGRTFKTVELEMPPVLKKAYNKLKRDLYIETKDEHKITTTGAGALYNKLRQVTSGFVIDSAAVKTNKFYDEDNTEVYLLDTYRFDALMQLLKENAGEQIIIWCSYRYEFEYIQQLLGNKCALLYGALSATAKQDSIRRFKSGKVQYLVAHPKSAKFGLTLTNAHIAVYFSLTFSYEDWKQSSERIYGRIESQPKHCIYYVLVAKGAIDDKIYNCTLNEKHSASMELLDHLKGPDL